MPTKSCQVCGSENLLVFFDAAVKSGRWANLCEKCWKDCTYQKLGTGLGQKYEWQVDKYVKVGG